MAHGRPIGSKRRVKDHLLPAVHANEYTLPFLLAKEDSPGRYQGTTHRAGAHSNHPHSPETPESGTTQYQRPRLSTRSCLRRTESPKAPTASPPNHHQYA